MADSRVRYHYPLGAVIVVAAAWLFFIVNLLIITCTLMWLVLFPVAPVIAIGFASLLVSAHGYAASVRTPIRSGANFAVKLAPALVSQSAASESLPRAALIPTLESSSRE